MVANDCHLPVKEVDSNKVIETDEFKIVQMLSKPVNCLFRYRIYDKTLPIDIQYTQRVDVEIYPDQIRIDREEKGFYGETTLSVWQFTALKLLPIDIKENKTILSHNDLTDDNCLCPWCMGHED